jgi:hypothetical protein
MKNFWVAVIPALLAVSAGRAGGPAYPALDDSYVPGAPAQPPSSNYRTIPVVQTTPALPEPINRPTTFAASPSPDGTPAAALGTPVYRVPDDGITWSSMAPAASGQEIPAYQPEQRRFSGLLSRPIRRLAALVHSPAEQPGAPILNAVPQPDVAPLGAPYVAPTPPAAGANAAPAPKKHYLRSMMFASTYSAADGKDSGSELAPKPIPAPAPIPTPARSAPAPAPAAAAPAPAHGLVADAPAECGCGGYHHGSCLHRLLAWATYHPITHGDCGCHCCCGYDPTPRLYTYFCEGCAEGAVPHVDTPPCCCDKSFVVYSILDRLCHHGPCGEPPHGDAP